MKYSRMIAVISLVPVLVLGHILHPKDTQNAKTNSPASPGTSTGTAIGNGIKAAITTAFPAISTIINAIWPGTNNSNKKKTDATTATTELKTQSVQGQAKINDITKDLDAVATFFGACVVAENNVIAMRTTLRLKNPLSAAETLTLNNQWNIAKGRLDKLKQAGSVVNNVSDTYIQTTLQAVVDANSGPIDNITNDLKAGPTGHDQLSSDLASLDSQLSAVNALAGVIIENVSLGLKGAKSVAAGGEGDTKMTQDEKDLQTELDSSLKLRFPKLAQ